MTEKPIRLALTPGAEDGVGPELIAKVLQQYGPLGNIDFFWCGDGASLTLAADRAGIPVSFLGQGRARLGELYLSLFPPLMEDCPLRRQARFLENCLKIAQNGQTDAIVTGPIDKACLQYLDEGTHKGQTEFFARHLARPGLRPSMAFLGGPFMLSLLTTHLPLADVTKAINEELVVEHIESIANRYAEMKKRKPSDVRIAVLGLNPHAGENGALGSAEKIVLAPAIRMVKDRGFNAEGPLPADGFFAYLHKRGPDIPDVVIAAYHDQGLIPYKLMTRGSAVNATLGLRIPRLSPAHGTAWELAGRGRACPRSTAAAIRVAIGLAKKNPLV